MFKDYLNFVKVSISEYLNEANGKWFENRMVRMKERYECCGRRDRAGKNPERISRQYICDTVQTSSVEYYYTYTDTATYIH